MCNDHPAPEITPDAHRTQQAWRAAIRSAIEAGMRDKAFNPTIPVEDIVALLVSLIDGLRGIHLSGVA